MIQEEFYKERLQKNLNKFIETKDIKYYNNLKEINKICCGINRCTNNTLYDFYTLYLISKGIWNGINTIIVFFNETLIDKLVKAWYYIVVLREQNRKENRVFTSQGGVYYESYCWERWMVWLQEKCMGRSNQHINSVTHD